MGDMKTITDKCDEAIKWLDANQLARSKNSTISRRRLNQCVTQSSPSCIKELVVCQEECLTWEVWVECQELALLQVEELAVLDQPSRKLINKTSAFYSFQAFCVYVKPKLA